MFIAIAPYTDIPNPTAISSMFSCDEHPEMKSSMSRKGNCWNNAPTESLWGRLKVGRLYGGKFATRRHAMGEVIDWLNF